MTGNLWVCKSCGAPIESGLTCSHCHVSLSETDIDLNNDVIAMQFGLRALYEIKRARGERPQTASNEPLIMVNGERMKHCKKCGTFNHMIANFCKECANQFEKSN